MSDIESYIRLVTDKFYTNTLGKVMEVQTGRFCKIKLISATENEIDLPVVNVPIGRWIGTSSPVSVGMIVPVYFSKWAMNQVIIAGTENTNGTPLKELQFSRNGAYALPIIFDDMLDDSFPEEIRFHQKPIFEEGAEFQKATEFNDSVTIEGTTTVADLEGDTVNVTTSVSKNNVPYNHP
jgi:hypothetical protein